MKAAVIEQRGVVENIVYREGPDPEIGPDEVPVRVKACAMNYLDLEVQRGMPDFPIETPWISGGDVAGVVEKRPVRRSPARGRATGPCSTPSAVTA